MSNPFSEEQTGTATVKMVLKFVRFTGKYLNFQINEALERQNDLLVLYELFLEGRVVAKKQDVGFSSYVTGLES